MGPSTSSGTRATPRPSEPGTSGTSWPTGCARADSPSTGCWSRTCARSPRSARWGGPRADEDGTAAPCGVPTEGVVSADPPVACARDEKQQPRDSVSDPRSGSPRAEAGRRSLADGATVCRTFTQEACCTLRNLGQMDKFVIEGGYPLSGTVLPAGNKNAALPMLAASLLTEEEVVIGNVPRIRDVDAMLALLEDLGVRVSWRDEHEVALRASSLTSNEVDPELATRIRASFLLAGPLVARLGEARMPSPGGDVIGRR